MEIWEEEKSKDKIRKEIGQKLKEEEERKGTMGSKEKISREFLGMQKVRTNRLDE